MHTQFSLLFSLVLAVDHCSPGSCAPNARCINEGTSFRCKCLAGYKGNGTLTGGCAIKRYIILLPAIGAPALLVFGFFLWKFRPKLSALPGTRNLKHLQASFKENSRIFTWAEMERATKCFRSDLKLGTGSFGTVYKGKLDDGTTVAIKKANNGNAPRIQQFLNEVTILSKVNHRNLVKMLGCCIEREVPLLVYEFVPRGTLYEHLHRRGDTLSWKNRLRIATETAEALTYLHFAASPPIYHRDVKSSNILLDEKLTAKVADFGISKLVPIDSTHISTTLHGTPGYIDPQYQQSYQLTDKSDVYSFGVVILEVITGQMPVDFSRCASDKNLSTFAMSVIQRGAISELIDKRLDARTPEMLECVAKVANLAALCLQFDGSSRPTMKFVLEELKKAMQPLME
ncbi:wall-associated receptor kinase-like 14 [Selaginella moellendorffii]|nr:wall-associated receptor kinase-like 14 [Selaginella moellendorffii]|eukprot:XP_002962688.2 wall-associated receptor kinase-like 14 [Selaginella moellendorffii]